jgi:glycoprotein 6-alpha-L-fucosyltransferase
MLYTSYVRPEIRPIYYPIAMPSDLAPRLIKLHERPYLFWVGQLMKYILRPQHNLQNYLDKFAEKLGFKTPIVGVHVRRTDKLIREAKYHSLEEYIVEINEFYDRLEMTRPVDKRRIYLASDDPSVLTEAKQKLPNYEIITNFEAAKVAQNLSTRYSLDSLQGFVLDLHLLSMTDYVVCTLTSEVCRVVYQLMQTRHVDGTHKVYSCDLQYYFTHTKARMFECLLPHRQRSNDEIDMEVGDKLEDVGTLFDKTGLVLVKNLRTNKTGNVPRFKFKEVFELVDFPAYPDQDVIEIS